MLIFDRFPSYQHAENFVAAALELEPELGAVVYESEAAAQDVDPIPVPLTAPVVHVTRVYDGDDQVLERARELGIDDPTARTSSERERRLERLAGRFGGRFVGT